MKKLISAIIAFVFFVQCTPKDQKIPKDILPIDSMKVIVWQLIEVGDYAKFLKEKDTAIKSLNTAYFNQVLKLHHLNKQVFFKNFNFYQSHPYFNTLLFDSVNAYGARQKLIINRFRQ